MRNHELYKQFKQIALDGDYTIEQVQNASMGQVRNLLGDVVFTKTFLLNMQRCLVRELQDRDDEVHLQNIRAVASSFLDSNFPGWAAEKGRDGDKRFIKIWLDGKPE